MLKRNSNNLSFTIYYRSQARTMQESGDTLHPSRFGLLLRNAGAVGDIRDCPVSCWLKKTIRNNENLMILAFAGSSSL